MPVLSITQPIPYFDTLKALAGPGHPVFLIACDDGSHLVIKKENTRGASGPQTLKHNLGAMRAVSPATAGKILTAEEVAVLQDFVDKSASLTRLFRWASEPADIGILRNYLTTTGTWFKMAKVDGLVGLDTAIAGIQQATKDKSGVRAFAAALNAPGGFEKIGKIAAADLYNGNEDRFTPAGEGSVNPLAENYGKFKAIVNIRNVLIGLDGGKMAPVGLDSFDPNGKFSKITRSIDHLETKNVYGDSWTGRLLAPNAAAQRRKFAQDIYDDLQAALGPRNRKLFFLSKNRLKANGPARILAGMEQGITLLRQRLTHQVGKPSPLAGLASRQAILG